MSGNVDRHPAAIEKLAASGPAAGLEEKLMLYGRLVGSWDVVSRDLGGDGEWHERRGEWHFAWVLGGRGVQDVLYAEGSTLDRFGTTLRCYDEEADVWHVAWMQPATGEFLELVGRAEGDRIVQVGRGTRAGQVERWTFSEISPESFLWQGEVSDDEGASWRLVQEMRATRRRSE
jgi:hypothetical protein